MLKLIVAAASIRSYTVHMVAHIHTHARSDTNMHIYTHNKASASTYVHVETSMVV